MKIEILQAFVTAAEHGSFSKAGEILYLSQPTVSRYISELEKHMGGALFIRNAHTCELTVLGNQVFIHARRIINEWNDIGKLAKKEDEKKEAIIRVGYNYEEALKLITPALANWSVSSANIEVVVRFGDGADITHLIRDEKLDCAIMHLPSISSSDGLEIRQICKCDMCMHASVKHRLAGQKSLKLEQLIHETDVRISRELSFYRQIDAAFSQLNLPQTKHIYVQNSMDCLPTIIHRNCIGFSADIYPPWPGCCKVPIEDWTTDFSLVFLSKSGRWSETTDKLYKSMCQIMAGR